MLSTFAPLRVFIAFVIVMSIIVITGFTSHVNVLLRTSQAHIHDCILVFNCRYSNHQCRHFVTEKDITLFPFYSACSALAMVDYGRLAIPAILILAVGGVISFFLAYNFYPEKHENVTVDGRCYELLDAAHKQYVNLCCK